MRITINGYRGLMAVGDRRIPVDDATMGVDWPEPTIGTDQLISLLQATGLNIIQNITIEHATENRRAS